MASSQRSEVYYMANFKSAVLTTGSFTKAATTANQTLIAAQEISNEDRISFQFYNTDSTADTVKVWGRLGSTTGTLALASDYTQIGDDITVSGTSSVLKSIATTGLNYVGVTISPGAASNGATYAILRQA